MHVGVVAYELEGERTGVGRYLAGLLGGAAAIDPGWRWTLYFHGPRFAGPLLDAPGVEAVFAGRPGRAWLWEQTRLPALLGRHRPDLVFSPSYSLPWPLPAPGVVTVHDLSFERLPEDFAAAERWRRRLLARLACRRAVRVLVDTAAMRRELAAVYALPEAAIGVVPLGVETAGARPAEARPAGGPAASIGRADEGEGVPAAGPRLLGADDRAALAALGVAPPYLLHLGTLLDRRRLDLVLDAFAALAPHHPELSLVIAGADRRRRRGEVERRLADPALGPRIVRVGWVPEAVVGPLYRGAVLSFYLSAYEGFGLPPLESLAHGTPAVVGPGLALDELWPDYPFRCERLEPGEVARVAGLALADPLLRGAVGAEGVQRTGHLTWRRAAARWLDELERARGTSP